MKEGVSVIVPTYNEEGNIKPLVLEIDKALKNNYEIIFIDDHSTDNTVEEIKLLTKKFPVKFYMKQGEKGKTFSLLEGFEKAKYPYIAMIDADLQYPPSAIPEMVKLLNDDVHIVASYRRKYKAPIHRQVLTKTTRLSQRIFWSLDYDTQSGLKVFKKSVLKDIDISTKNGWTFDLEFLVKAKKSGYKIVNYDITFNPREKGESKISVTEQIAAIKESWRLMRQLQTK